MDNTHLRLLKNVENFDLMTYKTNNGNNFANKFCKYATPRDMDRGKFYDFFEGHL